MQVDIAFEATVHWHGDPGMSGIKLSGMDVEDEGATIGHQALAHAADEVVGEEPQIPAAKKAHAHRANLGDTRRDLDQCAVLDQMGASHTRRASSVAVPRRKNGGIIKIATGAELSKEPWNGRSRRKTGSTISNHCRTTDIFQQMA